MSHRRAKDELDELRSKNISKARTAESQNPITRAERTMTIERELGPIVDSSRLLSNAKIQDQKKILEIWGLDEEIKNVATIKGGEIDRKEVEEATNTRVYTSEEIKTLCVNWDMRFVPINQIRPFLKNGKFKYILSDKTVEYLNKEKEEDERVKMSEFEAGKFFSLVSRSELKRKIKDDDEPALMLFYKTDSNSEFYSHVYTWGKMKYNYWNSFSAWGRRNSKNFSVHLGLIMSAGLMMVLGIMTSMSFISVAMVSMILGFITSELVVRVAEKENKYNDETMGQYFSENSWRSTVGLFE